MNTKETYKWAMKNCPAPIAYRWLKQELLIKNKNWNETHDFKWQWYIVVGFVTAVLLFGGEAKAGQFYDFPFEDNITMDVVKTNGGGGTWQCPSVRDCYIKTLEAEARGANQYCETITIKRNGKPVWFRKYR